MVMAEIGGPLAHQLPLHNHNHRGALQPSLVMNHHLDLDSCGGHTGSGLVGSGVGQTDISEFFFFVLTD